MHSRQHEHQNALTRAPLKILHLVLSENESHGSHVVSFKTHVFSQSHYLSLQ